MYQEEFEWGLVPFEVSAFDMGVGAKPPVFAPVPKEISEVEELEEGA